MKKIIALIALMAATPAAADDVSRKLNSGGFDIYRISSLSYDGCEYGKTYSFTGGDFTCSEHKYQYHYGTAFLLADGSQSYICPVSQVEDADEHSCARGRFR